MSSRRYDFPLKSHFFFSMSFDARMYCFTPRTPETHNFSTNIAISGKQNHFLEILRNVVSLWLSLGQPCVLSECQHPGRRDTNQALVLSWLRKENLHTLCSAHYNEVDIAPQSCAQLSLPNHKRGNYLEKTQTYVINGELRPVLPLSSSLFYFVPPWRNRQKLGGWPGSATPPPYTAIAASALDQVEKMIIQKLSLFPKKSL